MDSGAAKIMNGLAAGQVRCKGAALPILAACSHLYLRGCAHGRAAHAEARGEQFLSMLRPLNSLKISKR